MGKLWLIVLSAAGGFVAAVAGTPDDAERRAYDRGYADARQAVQNEAVRNGFASWAVDDQSGNPTHFQWAERSSRSRGYHDLSSHHSSGESPKTSDRHKKNTDKSDKPNAEAG